MAVFLAIIVFLVIVALTFFNGYWLITLDELELDHLNPADVAKRLNATVYPEMGVHGLYLLLCLITWAPWVFLLNLPMVAWHIHRISRKEHMLDPTVILRFKNLQATRNQAIVKAVFYGIQIVYGIYWMVAAVVEANDRHHAK